MSPRASSTPAAQAVFSTSEALEVLHHLEALYGPLLLFQVGGSCDGNSPICLKNGKLPLGNHDMRLGTVGGVPVYIDSEQYQRCGSPSVLIDVSPGAAEGFSLERLEGVHFVTRALTGAPRGSASGALASP